MNNTEMVCHSLTQKVMQTNGLGVKSHCTGKLNLEETKFEAAAKELLQSVALNGASSHK